MPIWHRSDHQGSDLTGGRRLALRVVAFLLGFPLGLPSFISECGLAGVLRPARKAASKRRLASASEYSEGSLLMTGPKDVPAKWTPTQPNHLEALGAIAAGFNTLELRLLGLFLIYMGYNEVIANLFARLRNNNTRVDLLRRSVEISDDPPLTKESVLHFITGINVCVENRNILMHSTATSIAVNEESWMFFHKAKSDNALERNLFVMDLEALKRVASEIEAYAEFGMRLYSHILGARRMHDVKPLLSGWIGGPLPEKPPRPNNLTPREFPKLEIVQSRP